MESVIKLLIEKYGIAAVIFGIIGGIIVWLFGHIFAEPGGSVKVLWGMIEYAKSTKPLLSSGTTTSIFTAFYVIVAMSIFVEILLTPLWVTTRFFLTRPLKVLITGLIVFFILWSYNMDFSAMFLRQIGVNVMPTLLGFFISSMLVVGGADLIYSALLRLGLKSKLKQFSIRANKAN
ncbi:MAG: hypothetical protein K8R79_05665 [Calditrichales bacterium]|nr:hypothetical protein [Calditrichales bacterium]